MEGVCSYKKERPRKFTFDGIEARFRCPCRAGISIRFHVAASISVSTTGLCKYSHVLFTRTNGTDFFDIAPTLTSRVISVYRMPV